MAEHLESTLEEGESPEGRGGALSRWRQTEPLRLWLYGVTVPLLAALVGYGLLTGHQAGLWLAVLTAALLGGGVETARQYVVAPATARTAVHEAALVSGDDEATARHVLIRYRIPS